MLKFRLFGLLMVVTFTSAQDGIVGRRVPSFIGTRGKKNQIDIEKEVPVFDFDAPSKLLDSTEDLRFNSDKRTARLGFQGTRGKKMSDYPYKKSVGFMGTRGKKYDSYSYPKMDDLEAYWLLRNELAKRKFYGMRGKKLPYSFNVMGARGKKGPSSTAFIGMRGKKDDTMPMSKDDYNSAENLAALISLLTTDKDYMKRHFGEDFDFEISDLDSQLIQDQQVPSNDVTNV